MFINFTLVIQACNFFVAYKVLRALLFKPALDALHEERSVQENLRLHIDATTVMIATREQEKDDQWRAFQQSCASQLPDVTSQMLILKDLGPQLHLSPLVDAHIQELEREMTHHIIKRVEHVRT